MGPGLTGRLMSAPLPSKPSGTHHPPPSQLWIYSPPKAALTGLLSVHPVGEPWRVAPLPVRKGNATGEAGQVNVK